MTFISNEDYQKILFRGFLIPQKWFNSAEPTFSFKIKNGKTFVSSPLDHHPEKNYSQKLSQKSIEILKENASNRLAMIEKPYWSLKRAAEIGLTYSGHFEKNQLDKNIRQTILEKIHLASNSENQPENNTPKKVLDNQSKNNIDQDCILINRVEKLVEEARLRSSRSNSDGGVTLSQIFNIRSKDNPLRKLTEFVYHITCGVAVMNLALHERNEIWDSKLDSMATSDGVEEFSRVALWELDEKDWESSVSRFQGTIRLLKESGLKKVQFDQDILNHIELGGCYEHPVILMGGWMSRIMFPGNIEYRNLVCNAELVFYIDHGLDERFIDMHDLLCKLGGCLELGIGVEHLGVVFATILYNHMKFKLEKSAEDKCVWNVRMRHLNRFEFLSVMICDIAVMEPVVYEKFGDDEINDAAICGFMQDFTDPGEDSAVGELGLSLSAWCSVLNTQSIRVWVQDMARLLNGCIFNRPNSVMVIANYTITIWNITNGRHHTLARSLAYLRHTKLGFINGETKIVDLFDEDMKYKGVFKEEGSLEEVDGEEILKECSLGFEFARKLKSHGQIAKNIIDMVDQLRDPSLKRVLDSALLLVLWFIYVPRLIRDNIEDVELSQKLAQMSLKLEDEIRMSIMVTSCWMEFDDKKFGLFRCREMCAEAAALYSLDNRMASLGSPKEFHKNFSFLGTNESRF